MENQGMIQLRLSGSRKTLPTEGFSFHREGLLIGLFRGAGRNRQLPFGAAFVPGTLFKLSINYSVITKHICLNRDATRHVHSHSVSSSKKRQLGTFRLPCLLQ